MYIIYIYISYISCIINLSLHGGLGWCFGSLGIHGFYEPNLFTIPAAPGSAAFKVKLSFCPTASEIFTLKYERMGKFQQVKIGM